MAAVEAFDPQFRSFREMVRVLRQFEGWWCVPRVLAAALAYGGIQLLRVAGAVAGIYVGADLKLSHVVLGVGVSLGSVSLATWISRRSPWRTVLANRLWTYERPNPLGSVELLVRDGDDAMRAYRALRRARFTPLYAASVGTPPDDAADLGARIGVQESEAWMRSVCDDDRLWRIAAILAAAGIRARVSSLDAFPGGQIKSRRTDDGRRLAPSAERA